MSNQEESTYSSKYRRRHDRIDYAVPIKFIYSHSSVYELTTSNVSLTGCMIKASTTTSGLKVGDKGLVEIVILEETKRFSCQVAHISDSGIGLLVERTFGAELTTSILGNLQTSLGMKLGIEIPNRSGAEISIVAKNGETIKSRLARLHSTEAEFCVAASRAKSFQDFPDDYIAKLSLPTETKTLSIKLKVSAVNPPSSNNICRNHEKTVQVHFILCPMETKYAIKGFIKSLHQNRLTSIIQQRNQANTIKYGQDIPRKKRDDVARDLQRFHGFSTNK